MMIGVYLWKRSRTIKDRHKNCIFFLKMKGEELNNREML